MTSESQLPDYSGHVAALVNYRDGYNKKSHEMVFVAAGMAELYEVVASHVHPLAKQLAIHASNKLSQEWLRDQTQLDGVDSDMADIGYLEIPAILKRFQVDLLSQQSGPKNITATTWHCWLEILNNCFTHNEPGIHRSYVEVAIEGKLPAFVNQFLENELFRFTPLRHSQELLGWDAALIADLSLLANAELWEWQGHASQAYLRFLDLVDRYNEHTSD
jgi:hypothetical protein